MSDLKTTLGQLHIVSGQRQEQAPGLLAVERPRQSTREHRQDRLYILAEIQGEPYDKDDLLQQMSEAASQTYYNAAGSITSGLQEGLNAAGAILFQRNLDNPYEGRLVGGMVCAVLRGNDCFIGQTGPAVSYVAQRGEMTRYPASSPWLDVLASGEDESPAALGLSRHAEVNLFRCEVADGDAIVLAGGELARRASGAAISAAVIRQPLTAALDGLAKLGGGADFSALVVEITAAGALPERAKPGEAPKKEAIPAATARREEPKKEAIPAVTARREEPRYEEPGVIVRPQRKAAARPGALSRILALFGGFWRAANLPRLLGNMGKALLALLALLWHGLSTLVRRILPGDWEKRPARRQAEAGGRREKDTAAIRRKLLLGVAIGIPLLILLIVGGVYLQKGRAREQKFGELVQGARARYEQAATTGDTTTARSLLKEALNLLGQAEEIRADEAGTAVLRREIEDKADEIDKVRRLVWFAELQTYQDAGSQLGRVLVTGVDIYVLDSGLGRVYHHVLNEAGNGLRPNEANPTLVSRGQQVEGATVNGVIDMTWVQAGGGRQTSDLLILGEGGILLEYNPTWGITTLPIASADLWQTPVRVGSYFGNFYVLDPGVGQIFRYLPTTDGYSNPPQDYLSKPNPVSPGDIVDMAIDGHIYLLFADGTVRRLLSGEPVSFELSGLDEPLQTPVAIYTAPDEEARFIYIADAGARRVVQIDKDGRLIRQFKAAGGEQFADLRGLYVDEIGGRLYFTSGNKLYLANLPAN
jgi:hypothetical protein